MAVTVHTTLVDAAREAGLVARADRDAGAFRQLFDAYLPRIYGFVARRVDDRTAVEELVSATFERAVVALQTETFENASFGAFLYRVAATAVVDHSRRLRKAIPSGVRASDYDQPGDADAANALADERALRWLAASIDRAPLRRAVLDLDDADRRVLLLTYLDGLEPDDLCAALGCSRPAYALRLHQALRAVAAAITGEATDAA